MGISGVIFEHESSGHRLVAVAKKISVLKQTAKLLNTLGKLMVIGGALVGFVLFAPVLKEEFKYAMTKNVVGKTAVAVSNANFIPTVVTKDELKTSWKVPDENYSIYIPKIVAKSKVIEQVDPFNQAEYMAALKQGVAAAALGEPGKKGTTYLFAHSVGNRVDFARYNAIFYLLHKLEAGDEIEIVYKKKLYTYRVEKKEVLAATDLHYLQPQSEKEMLVLQTCYPPGTSWKRLLVIARPVAS